MSKRPRGLETVGDMVRSLGIVVAVILVLVYLAQPPDSDEARIRPVSPAGDIRAYREAVPGVPVPGALPQGWVATSSAYDPQLRSLRIGWVTPSEQYAEFDALPGTDVFDVVGDTEEAGSEVVEGLTWQLLREKEDGSLSLVRRVGDATLVVGSLRATASVAELRVLAGALA